MGWKSGIVATAVALLAGVLLYRFPPERYTFYPRCPFHAATGLLCPGCGTTRALGALVHGDVGSALRFNPLMPALMAAMLVVFFAQRFCRSQASQRWFAGATLGLIVALTFVRNILG
jgi:hypothetical protein